jgi:hypothetical protein
MFGHMKDPVEGTATLVSYGVYEQLVGGKNDAVLQVEVVVQAPGLEPTAVEAVHTVRKWDLPLAPGTVWRVKVDRAKPKHLEFLDDEVDQDAARDAGRAAAEELAQRMRDQKAT